MGKYRPEKTPYLDKFHTVISTSRSLNISGKVWGFSIQLSLIFAIWKLNRPEEIFDCVLDYVFKILGWFLWYQFFFFHTLKCVCIVLQHVWCNNTCFNIILMLYSLKWSTDGTFSFCFLWQYYVKICQTSFICKKWTKYFS